MKSIIVLFLFISFYSYSQNSRINSLFFEVPLNESRDSIYNYLLGSENFLQKKDNYSYSANAPKVYSGYYNKSDSEFKTKNTDSLEVQLTFGSVSIEGKEESKKLLIFYTYNYMTDKKSANRRVKILRKRINDICKKKPNRYKIFNKEENEIKEKYVGFGNHWYLKNNMNLEIILKYEILKENEKYLIEMEYSRYE